MVRLYLHRVRRKLTGKGSLSLRLVRIVLMQHRLWFVSGAFGVRFAVLDLDRLARELHGT
jgi:hypothetical protein